jgi:hypothetical protein
MLKDVTVYATGSRHELECAVAPRGVAKVGKRDAPNLHSQQKFEMYAMFYNCDYLIPFFV